MENTEIGIFKLVSGDVIIGKFDKSQLQEDEVVVTKPMQLMLDPTQGGVGMLPYDAIFSQIEPEDFTFKTRHVMHEIPVHKSFEDAYIQHTTGIMLGGE
jgi:hypothetical protein